MVGVTEGGASGVADEGGAVSGRRLPGAGAQAV